jgi:hypothetical protein
MSELRAEVLEYIELLPDSKLEALRPILRLLTNDTPIVETNLTDEEKEIIRAGRIEYKAGGYIPLDEL